MGAVVPGPLVQGAFGRSCVLLCDIYKHSKCEETIPHVDKLSICRILYMSVGPASETPKLIHYRVVLFHTPDIGLIDL